jgi:steroid delta-isomerase-like uncharacterized protein
MDTAIGMTASEGLVLIALSDLNSGRVDDAITHFAEQFKFTDHGIGLEFMDKERLIEFFQKAREFYPDYVVHAERVFVSGDHVIMDWTLQATLTEPFFGALSRKVRVSLPGVSLIRIDNGKISDWADYYDGRTSRRMALASFFTEWVEL